MKAFTEYFEMQITKLLILLVCENSEGIEKSLLVKRQFRLEVKEVEALWRPYWLRLNVSLRKLEQAEAMRSTQLIWGRVWWAEFFPGGDLKV